MFEGLKNIYSEQQQAIRDRRQLHKTIVEDKRKADRRKDHAERLHWMIRALKYKAHYL